MDSIIKKVYYGEIRPCEKSAPPTERYISNRKEICETEDELLTRYPDSENLIEKYKDALRTESQYECEADFERGFRLGVMLMINIISKD